MARVKRGVTTRAKHKRILDQAKGYYGRRKNTIRIARQAVEKAGQYAYRDRKVKKRSFRALWIQRINAASRQNGLTYNRFIQGLGLAGVQVDRRMLAELAVNEPATFASLVQTAKSALPSDVNAPKSFVAQPTYITTYSIASDQLPLYDDSFSISTLSPDIQYPPPP